MTFIMPRIPLLGSLLEVANNYPCIILEKNKSERFMHLCTVLSPFSRQPYSTYAANPFVGYPFLGGKVKVVCCVLKESYIVQISYQVPHRLYQFVLLLIYAFL